MSFGECTRTNADYQVAKLTTRLLADSTVFALTAYRALKLSRDARGGVRSLIDLILRDGESLPVLLDQLSPLRLEMGVRSHTLLTGASGVGREQV